MTELKVTMVFERSTKNTHLFKSEDENSPIPSIYIKKSGIGENVPTKIEVIINEM